MNGLDPDLMSGLRDQAERAQPDWDAMERRLLDAFTHRPVAADPRRWRWAAVAAALVLAAGVSWRLVSSSPVVPVGPSSALPRAEALEPPAATALAPPAATASVPRTVRPPARARPPQTTRRSTAAEDSAGDPLAQFAGFVTLPGAGTLPDFESGHIVRIEVPIAGLPAYGLDLLPDAAPAAVEADVLVGQDGAPRAIRLASTNQ